ncbi:hypothetical protein N9043_01065 [bacterium]|nr:hypothetical protein [bacterium]
MSCTPKCYDFSPIGYDSGIYQLQYDGVEPIWFAPANAEGDRVEVTTPALLTQLSELINDPLAQQVVCDNSSCCDPVNRVSETICFSNGTNKITTISTLDVSGETPVVDGGLISDKGDDTLIGDSFTGEAPAGYTRSDCNVCSGCVEVNEPFEITAGSENTNFSFVKALDGTLEIYHPDDAEMQCEPALTTTLTAPDSTRESSDEIYRGQGGDGQWTLDFSQAVDISMDYWSFRAPINGEYVLWQAGDTLPDTITPGTSSVFITGATIAPDGSYTGGTTIPATQASLDAAVLPIIWHDNNSTSRTTFGWEDTDQVSYFLATAAAGTGTVAMENTVITAYSYKRFEIGPCSTETTPDVVEASTIESRELCIDYYGAGGVITKSYGVGVFKLTESATELLRVETRSGEQLTEGTGDGQYQIAPSSDCDCNSGIL